LKIETIDWFPVNEWSSSLFNLFFRVFFFFQVLCCLVMDLKSQIVGVQDGNEFYRFNFAKSFQSFHHKLIQLFLVRRRHLSWEEKSHEPPDQHKKQVCRNLLKYQWNGRRQWWIRIICLTCKSGNL
jgi:hypothetical protein